MTVAQLSPRQPVDVDFLQLIEAPHANYGAVRRHKIQRTMRLVVMQRKQRFRQGCRSTCMSKHLVEARTFHELRDLHSTHCFHHNT